MIAIKSNSPKNYQKKWEYTHDWRIPLKPKFELKCPICKGKTRFKEYYPHSREFRVAGKQPRIDIWYKCEDCGYVWVHGVHITEEYYQEVISKMMEKIGRVRPLHILEIIDLERQEEA